MVQNIQFVQTLQKFLRLFLAAIFLGAGTWAFFSLAALAQQTYGWSGFDYSLILFASSVTCLLSGFYYSRIVKCKNFLLSVPFACVLCAVVLAALAFSPSTYFLWVLFGLIDGIFVTWVYLAMEGEIYEKADEQGRARSFTMYVLMFALGGSLAPIFVNWGQTEGFISAIVFFLVVAIIYPRSFQEDEDDSSPLTVNSILGLVKRAPYLWSLAFIGGVLGETLSAFIAPVSMAWEYSEQQALSLISATMIGAVLLQYPISLWVDKGWRRGRIWLILIALVALLLLLSHTSESYAVVTVIIFILGGFGAFMSIASLAILADRFGKEDKALAVSLSGMFYASGNIMGPPVMGIMLDIFGGNGVLTAFAIIICVPLLIGFMRYRKRFVFKTIWMLYRHTRKRMQGKAQSKIRLKHAQRGLIRR